MVGVNFKPSNESIPATPPFVVPAGTAEEAIAGLERVRASRDAAKCRAGLAALRQAARDGRNTMPALLEAARARATIGEITAELAAEFGRYSSGVEFGTPIEAQDAPT